MTAEDKIELGRSMKRLSENEDFSIFSAEIIDRIREAQSRLAGITPETEKYAPLYIYTAKALGEALEWIDDCIEAGAFEAERKAKG